MNWHTFSEKEVLEKLGSSNSGLKRSNISERIEKYGENKIVKAKSFNALKVFFSQFKSFLILILIFAAILSFFMESVIDSVVIFLIIILNAGLGFAQEYKAEKAIEELKKMMVPKAKVIRDGKVVEIDSSKIVPGDILVLNEGDKIMADARVLSSEGFRVNEAALTGESVPQGKVSRKLKLNISLADRDNMIYQGTEAVSGNCKAIVVDTGMSTELGRISTLVQEVEPERNPFREKLDNFAKKIGIFIIILSVLVVGLLIWAGTEVFESFLVAVSLAVSAIPEGLPAVISLALALATRRMLKNNVLVRKLPASETLGRTTIICTDKTGTLTEEKMTVDSIYANGSHKPKKGKDFLFKVGILCNDARLEENEEGEYFIGDPTEIALIVSAKNNFISKKEITEKEPKVKEFPFNSERKMMSIVRKTNTGMVSYVKGAPEKIIERSSHELIDGRSIPLDNYRKQELIKIYEGMAKKGLRVLGFAYKKIKDISQDEAEQNLVFVGFQGMIDPPRPEVKGAIKLCNDAGINVIMITGDSNLTANAVAREIGLSGDSVDSDKLGKMSDKDLFKQISGISVFSRISPEDKLRIINILKQKNEIVAMTGDGVNDALALKRADIGISMGIRGTDVARNSSEIVLLDDNFASIVQGVKEGRRIYDNTRKFVKFLLSANFAEIMLVLTVMLIWRDPSLLPLLPLQILWINLVTDSLPALALGSEPMEKDIMKRKPNKGGILHGITGFILFVGILVSLVDFLVFYWYMGDIIKARTMATTASIVFQMLVVFNCKSKESIFKSQSNKYLIGAVLFSIAIHLLVLYTPAGALFSFVSLNLGDWIKIIGFSIGGFILIEGYKWVVRLKK